MPTYIHRTLPSIPRPPSHLPPARLRHRIVPTTQAHTSEPRSSPSPALPSTFSCSAWAARRAARSNSPSAAHGTAVVNSPCCPSSPPAGPVSPRLVLVAAVVFNVPRPRASVVCGRGRKYANANRGIACLLQPPPPIAYANSLQQHRSTRPSASSPSTPSTPPPPYSIIAALHGAPSDRHHPLPSRHRT